MSSFGTDPADATVTPRAAAATGAAGRAEPPPFPGVVLELGSNRPFVLEETSVWFVERGDVDIFSVLQAEGAPAASRRHLLRVHSGDLLLGLGAANPAPGEPSFIGVATNGSRLLQAPRATLRALLEEPLRAERAQLLLVRWIESLSRAMAEGRPARAAGSAPVDPPGAETLWAGLVPLAVLVRKHVQVAAAKEEQAGRARSERLATGQRVTIQRACARLAAALQGGNGLVPNPVEGRSDPAAIGGLGALLECCRRVGLEIGVDIRAPSESENANSMRDPFAAIMRNSRLRSRKVALTEEWWRHDHGPLVAFRAEGGGPVALIRRGRRYLIHDPLQAVDVGVDQPVDEEAALTLAPFAHTIYRPFPDGPLGAGSLLRFALRGCRRDFLVVALMAGVVTIVGMVPALATSHLFNNVIPRAQRSQLWQITMLLVVCALANVGFSIARGIALLRIHQRMGTGVQAAVWDRLMRLPLTFFRPYTAGDLATRAMSVDAIQQVISGVTITAILSGLFSLGNLFLMFSLSATMAWRALVFLALAVAVNLVGGLMQRVPERAMLKLRAKTSGLVLQLLTSISKLRIAGAEARAFSQWVDRFSEQRRSQLQVRSISNWLNAFNAAFPVLATVLIFMAGLPLLGSAEALSRLQTGDFLAFGAAFSGCLGAVLGGCRGLVDSLSSIALYDQARPILETPPETQSGKSDPGLLTGEIEIQHAVFRYSKDGPLTLRDVSLHIKPGEFVAFVGPSGSGKSTLLRLMLGFESPESGSIFFDGQEIRGLDIQEVRRQMGVVLQNGRLIVGDVFRNIVGSANATQEEAWEAARLAGVADDIKAMPMKMHTVIGEDASTLSGGQRQRLMIARAIVNRPRILLFDEATSALDNRTQAIVTASLEGLRATRVVVAHRLSTIAKADRIYVIERGRIVQQGTYGQLIQEKGAFYELAQRQMV
jgi:NHLM bacteriocin system ABC transporter ATP-binding protein